MITPGLYTSHKACHVVFQWRGSETVETYEVDAACALSPSIYNRALCGNARARAREREERIRALKSIDRFIKSSPVARTKVACAKIRHFYDHWCPLSMNSWEATCLPAVHYTSSRGDMKMRSGIEGGKDARKVVQRSPVGDFSRYIQGARS